MLIELYLIALRRFGTLCLGKYVNAMTVLLFKKKLKTFLFTTFIESNSLSYFKFFFLNLLEYNSSFRDNFVKRLGQVMDVNEVILLSWQN